MIENVHIVISNAASVKFVEQIQKGLNINFYGTQRMLELAKECKNIEVFSHVSTAYVNCNREGAIEEKIYFEDGEIDPI